MEYRHLGQTGLKVSRLCFGALTIGPLQAGLSIQAGAQVLRHALEQGVNFIDTAELYGTYPYIKEALKGFDREVVIASKSYAYTREGMIQSLEQARSELDRDVVDIFLLHEQESILTVKGHWPALEYLLEAKAKGLVRAVGLSTHRIAGVVAGIEVPEIEVIHPLFNSTGLGITDGTRDEMASVIAQAKAVGKGIYSMKPLGGDNLLHQMEQALNYVLAQPTVDAIALGMKSVAEVEMNCHLFAGQPVPEQVKLQVSQLPRSLHIESWCEGCGQCIERCPAGALALQAGVAVVETKQCLLCGYCGAVCPQFCIKIM